MRDRIRASAPAVGGRDGRLVGLGLNREPGLRELRPDEVAAELGEFDHEFSEILQRHDVGEN
jgi:hypothetical protein